MSATKPGTEAPADQHPLASRQEVCGVCPMDCPDTCSWVVTVEDGRAVKLTGDRDHPYTRRASDTATRGRRDSASGHKSYGGLREKVRATPGRRKRVEEIGEAYDTLLALGELRESCGLTQADLAREMGVSQPNISRIENNADPHLSTLDSFVRKLGGIWR